MIKGKLFHLNILLIVIFISTLVSAQDEELQLLKFKSAKVKVVKETKNQFVTTTITEDVFLDNYGAREARFVKEVSENKMVNQKTEKNSLIIIDGEWMYNIDLDAKKGKKMKNLKKEFLGGMDQGDMEKMAQKITGSMNADVKKIGQKEIAGVLCDGTVATTNFAGMKTSVTTYMYKNYIFFNSSEAMGTKNEERVVEFKEGVDVDSDKFKVPSGIDIEEMSLPFGDK